MTSKINGSHKDDALGQGRSKRSQVPSVPKDGNDVPTQADLTPYLNRNRAEDAQLVAELAKRHQHKKDTKFGDPNPSGVEPASGETTRANRQPGVLPPGANTLPASSAGVHHNKPEKSAHGGSFDRGGQGRAYPPRTSIVPDAVCRDPKKLEETKRRQFRFGNTN